ncbi:MAG TPA: chromate efflux transporter, partial [Polyangiaceae bacterium]|nr:chromate efflux transporter [Polyangiaceae bacterium]
ELVDKRRWLSDERFLHALNYCMLLPGPEAQQLATYIGWLLHRVPGGIIAGTLFVLPGFLGVLVLSLLYAFFQQQPTIAALFFGLKAAVLAVVVEAVLRIGKRALKSRFLVAIAASAFIALFLFDVPFPAVVLAAGLLGFLGGRAVEANAGTASRGVTNAAPKSLIEWMAHRGELAHTAASPASALRVLAVCGALWVVPLLALARIFGTRSVFVQEGLLFSKAALVTFGGAYAALAYVAQRAVEVYGWLTPREMLDGLGLAETTPGPLILVVEFVAFVGAFRNPAGLSPWVSGLVGATVTVWVTFVPCFLWIFLGAPYIESLRGNRSLSAALTGITAAVVGVILNLAFVFGTNVVFHRVRHVHCGPLNVLSPEWGSVDVAAALLAAFALLLLLRFKLGLPRTLLACALLGAGYKLALGR